MKILSEFISDWRTTGAVIATSRFTQQKMLDCVDWEQTRLIVELGSGCGCITRAILRRLHRDARCLAIEINDRFVDRLQRDIDDPRLLVVHGSATELPRVLADRCLPLADAILCSLPFSTLPSAVRLGIVQASADSLSSGGRMISIQYHPFVLPPLLRDAFGEFRVGLSWLNLPPALVYTCTRLSSSSPSEAVGV